jgi:hypothetical protein
MSVQNEHTKKEKFLTLYRKTGNISNSCQAANIGRTTFYEWKSEDENFAQAVSDAKDAFDDLAEMKLKQMMLGDESKGMDANPTLLIFYLKTQVKHRGYVERQEFSGDLKVVESTYTLPDGTTIKI